MPKAAKYAWVTSEMYDAKLAEVLDEVGGSGLLAVPGVYEVVSEHFNNDVLEALERERDKG